MEISSFISSLKKLDYNQVPTKLMEKAFQKQYTLKSLDVSARTLQSWFDSGLLPYDKLYKGQKHWFNFVHLIWLYIVRELRVFGLPLKAIKKAKEQLLEEYTVEEMIFRLDVNESISILEIFNIYDESKESEYRAWFKKFKNGEKADSLQELFGKEIPLLSDLFILLVQLILGEDRFFLTIDRDGHVEEFSSDQASSFNQFIGFSTKIVLPLNSFFYQYVGEAKHLVFLNEIGMINKIEADLLNRVHQGDYDKITIKFSNKKMDMAEYSRQIKKTDIQKIINIVARKQYQELNIKTEDGDIRYLNVTQKVKIK